MASRFRSQLTPLPVLGAALLVVALSGACEVGAEPDLAPTVVGVTPTPSVVPSGGSPSPQPSPLGRGGQTGTVVETPVATIVGGSPSPQPSPARGEGAGLRVLMVGGQPFRVELAVTREEQLRGLLGRESLDPDAGMLFVFSVERTQSFWMKETLIPLDLIYLDAEGTVVSVHTMAPEPGVPDALLTRYSSAGPALYALEINAGLAEALGVAWGEVVDVGEVVG